MKNCMRLFILNDNIERKKLHDIKDQSVPLSDERIETQEQNKVDILDNYNRCRMVTS